ncbi:DNA repair helicase XPB [Paenibacillus chartarius]|uniref:DNA 3'-5' helicase n=1 Tax=Paenibacillus chartarius TaxID=747481 RepID=A0ABV6DKQ0_9BACL
MRNSADRPLVVQKDLTVLLETHHPEAEELRANLSRFAELVKSPEHVQTYRMTPLTLWQAAAAGMSGEDLISWLEPYSKFPLPAGAAADIRKYVGRYGLLRLERVGEELLLVSEDTVVLGELMNYAFMQKYIVESRGERAVQVLREARGELKQELAKLGYPVSDMAGYHRGEALAIRLKGTTAGGADFRLRDYQEEAVDAFYRGGSTMGGSGVVVLPCGAGKTVIGIAAMAKLGCATLVLTSNVTSVRQWKREILDKTELTEEQVGEYTGETKEVKPVTIATYQIITHRKAKDEPFVHLALFNRRDWGLIVYDEVHLLPAPVFRATADIQATRRLGLTATLIREDGRESDVFSLIGPKRYELPWRKLERSGWIATVECTEIQVPLSEERRAAYAGAEARRQFRLAGENAAKLDITRTLLQKHAGEPTLIIGQYLEQLKLLSKLTGAPMISGETGHEERERLYAAFKAGRERVLIVSKVANFAVDLPDASVAIQVSGSFGSRQEEAQRLGRILRPKPGANKAYFYTIVSKDTKEQEFTMKRQLFLVEQGYSYSIVTVGGMASAERGGLHRVPSSLPEELVLT